MPPIWTVLALGVIVRAALAQPLSTFYINETRLFATASSAAPDLTGCHLPDDAGGGGGAIFPAQSAKFVWLWASLAGSPAGRPVTIQVAGLRSRQVVRAWDRHQFPDAVGCVAGSFAIGALRDRFGAEQVLAQLLVDDDLMASIPFALVAQPLAIGRSLVAVAPRSTEVACDFKSPTATTLNVTEDAVVYLCVDVDLVDRRRLASIQFVFRTGSSVVSSYRNDGADLASITSLFMPVAVRQLMAAADLGGATFSAEFRYDDRLMASQNFTLKSAGGAVRFCPSANCSSTTNAA